MAACHRSPPLDRRDPPPPRDDRAAGGRVAAARLVDGAGYLAGGRCRARCRTRPGRPGVAVGRPAGSDRARLFRRSHPAGDRRADSDTARDRQEPDATRPADDAPTPRSRNSVNDRDDAASMTCDDVRDMAGAYVLGALDPTEEAGLRAHVASCDDAHAEIADLGGVVSALAESV